MANEINSLGIPLFPLDPMFGGSGLSNIPLNSLIVGNVTDPYLSINPGTNGQVLIGASGQIPAFATLTSNGGTITFTPGPNSLNLEASGGGGGITWNEVTGTSQSAAINNGYITNNAGLVTVTLPSTAALGSIVRLSGKGAGGWKLGQNSGQTVYFGAYATTGGTGGYLASTLQYDTVEVICITADTTWAVLSAVGNLTVV